jgi:hypothetical protein
LLSAIRGGGGQLKKPSYNKPPPSTRAPGSKPKTSAAGGFAAAKKAAEEADEDPGSYAEYPYELLAGEAGGWPEDVMKNRTRREMHLSDAEFERLFGMGKEEFKKMPKWKSSNKKKALKLF